MPLYSIVVYKHFLSRLKTALDCDENDQKISDKISFFPKFRNGENALKHFFKIPYFTKLGPKKWYIHV